MKMNRIYWLLLVVMISCSDDDSDDQIALAKRGTNVIVLNEGNFQSANGSISIYNTSTEESQQKVFQANNSSRPIGDVVQSLTSINDQYFIVVNNSNKIEVVNSNDFTSVGKIEGLNSPRYILPISATKAYVSDLYEDKLYVINPRTLTVEKTIETKGWTEQMVLIDNKAFVCQVDSSMIYVFDVDNDNLIQKIPTNLQPQHLEVDAEGKLWVSCSGGINQGYPALHRINPISFEVEETLELQDNSKSIGELEMNSDKTKVLYLMNDVFELSIQDRELPTTPKILANGRLFYAFEVHEKTGDIYLSDAIDYLQRGVVYRMDSLGREQTTFKAGIIPGAFYFQDF